MVTSDGEEVKFMVGGIPGVVGRRFGGRWVAGMGGALVGVLGGR